MLQQFPFSRLLLVALCVCLSISAQLSADEQPEPFKRSPFWAPHASIDDAQVLRILDTSLELQIGKAKPVMVKFSDVLAKGKIEKDASDGYGYGRDDLKVGDIINARLKALNSEHVISDIQISRRPKGKVPPSQRPDPDRPYHEWKNAWIDLNDHGIPYPMPVCVKWGFFPNGKPVPHPDFWKNILNSDPPQVIPLIKD
jgi:hypothetical protein